MTDIHDNIPDEVREVYETFPGDVRARLFELRGLIFQTADETESGPLTEALKWGEPSYLTEATGAGSTIRLGWTSKDPEAARVFFICTTRLVDEMRARFPEGLQFEGNRALRLPIAEPAPEAALRECFALALTYKRRKTSAR